MVKFCFECGAKNNGGKFCAECGTRFTDDSSNGNVPPAAANAVANQLNAQMHTNAFNGGHVAAAAPYAAQAATAYGKAAYQPTAVATATPVAVPVATSSSFSGNRPSAFAANNNNSFNDGNGSARSSAFAANNNSFNNGGGRPSAFAANNNSFNDGNGSARPSAFRSSFNNNSFNTQKTVEMAPEPVPPAAIGAEAQEVYENCVQTIRAARGGNNEAGVKAFKQNCKLFGLKQMEVKTFHDSLVGELGVEGAVAFVPTLSRLIPDDNLRKDLIEYNATQRGFVPPPPPPYLASRDSSSSSGSEYQQRPSYGAAQAGSSKGILKNRYGDHPNCDVCNVAFDVTKRRHQCRHCGLYICNSCSPIRLLIPPGKQFEGTKGYDPSVPQRVCIQCAPQLHQYQDELVAQYAQSREQNLHEAKGGIHVPFSNSLLKECNTAADIIGNFFRDDWGASADRSIPVAFLQRAHGLAIMTIVKAGFLITGKIGTGLVFAKLPDGSWSAPSAIGTIGLGGGFEIGGEIVEVMIILGSESAVKVFHKPQVNLGAGLDVTVGPYGRSALAAAAVSTSGLNANYSYSQSKGLYAGISLQGAVIATRSDLNRKFYGRDLQPSEILNGFVEQPNAARPLYEAVDRAMQGIEDHRNEVARRSSIMGPCRLCNCPMFVAHTKQVWNKNCKTCKHVH